MKLVRYGQPGQELPGLIDAEGNIRSLRGHCDDVAGDVLGSLDQLRDLDWEALPIVSDDTRLGPCVAQTGKFICIGLNFSDHAAESGMAVPGDLVSYISQFMTLEPGDVISTGTPPGVGMGQTPPRYLRASDEVRLGIQGLGEQHQTCQTDPGPQS